MQKSAAHTGSSESMSFDNDNRSFASLSLVVRRNQYFKITLKKWSYFSPTRS
jgi:hypothetical protein